jgi:trigger factor
MVLLAARDESETRATLDIEVPAEDVERTYGAVARAFAQRAAMPGFRRGHVPESLVQQRFAGEIREEVLERLLPVALSSAIEEKNLAVLGSPRVENLEWNPPGPIRFSAHLDLKPVVDPGEYRGIPVEDAIVEPSDEEVSQVLDRIRESHAEFHPIEGRRASAGDFRAVRRDPGAGSEPSDVPRREADARDRASRLDGRDQRRVDRRHAGGDPHVPKDVCG